MEVVHVRCAGLDVSKMDAKVCVRLAGAGRRKTVETVTTWGSTTRQVLALREHLIAEKVTCVVMEATGDCLSLQGPDLHRNSQSTPSVRTWSAETPNTASMMDRVRASSPG